MTLVIASDFNLSYTDRMSLKADAATHVRALAAKRLMLGPTDIDVRDAVAGGIGVVTTAQTGLPTSNFGLAANLNLDIPLIGVGVTGGTTAFVGWLEAAAGLTAFTLSALLPAGLITPPTKVYTFYGVEDLTAKGDLSVLRFESGPAKFKAYLEFSSIYESSIGNLVGGYFSDSDTGALGYIDYGVVINEPLAISAIFLTSADKAVRIRTLVGEKQGEVVNVVPS